LSTYYKESGDVMEQIKSIINPFCTLDYMTTAEENKYFDRKSAKIKVSDLADLISAFANAEGGTIVIGISDKTKKVRESMRLMQKKSTIFFPRRKTAVNQCQIIKKNFLM